MGTVKLCATLVVFSCLAAACTVQTRLPSKEFADVSGGARPLGLTCPTMINVEYGQKGFRRMLGASPSNPSICIISSSGRAPEEVILNWYSVARLRSDLDQAVEILSSLLTGPVGFTTTWTRFVGNAGLPYEAQFTVAPDQSIDVGGRIYNVRVIKAKNARFEDNEYWFDKDSLILLKYINHINGSQDYTATRLVKMPAS